MQITAYDGEPSPDHIDILEEVRLGLVHPQSQHDESLATRSRILTPVIDTTAPNHPSPLPETDPETSTTPVADAAIATSGPSDTAEEETELPVAETETTDEVLTDTTAVVPARSSDDSATAIPWSANSGRGSLFVEVAIRKRRDFTFGDGSSVKWQSKTQKGILYHPVLVENERQVKELFPQPLRTEVVSLPIFALCPSFRF